MPAMYDVSESWRVTTVTDASAMGAPKSMSRNSAALLPADV